MNLVKLKAGLAGAGTCPVLSEHILNMALTMPDLPEDISAIDGMNLILRQFFMSPYAGYFEDTKSKIIGDTKIPPEQIHDVFQGLDFMAKTHIMYALVPLMNEDIIDGFEDLKKIEKAAQKLKDLLPEKDSTLYTILTMIEQTQSQSHLHFDENTNNAALYFTNLETMLDGLVKLRSIIPQTPMGQFMKLGVKSPKGNLGLKVWLEQAYEMWTGTMGRNFKHDGKDGVNGRKRFTEFTYNTLIIIHPAITYTSVEQGVRALLEKRPKISAPLPPKNIS